jgi:hypothetical protein
VGHRQADANHVSQIGSLSAQKAPNGIPVISHMFFRRIQFVKTKDPFFDLHCHLHELPNAFPSIGKKKSTAGKIRFRNRRVRFASTDLPKKPEAMNPFE